MASTRNRNTSSEYNTEQNAHRTLFRHNMYNGAGRHESPALPLIGSNPSKMYAGHLTSNSVDVETQLRGIGSTNLEGPSFKVDPRFYVLDEVSYFDRKPVVLPPSFLHNPNERPQWLA
jgi:hypothetical protein